jgi:uncharacterized membrane protein YfcA
MPVAFYIKAILLITILTLIFMAMTYLRQRKLSWTGYCFWGILAVLLPVIGPFLVIAFRPGEWQPH